MNDNDIMESMADKAKVVFELCDQEGKGFITKRDMLRLQDEVPLSPEQLEVVFDNLDVDKKGFLTIQTFVNGFGQFVGLSPSTKEGFEFVSNDISLDAMDAPSQSLATLIENFDACQRHEDIIAIKSLWRRLNREQPDVLSKFEDFVARIVSMLQNTQMDYKALQASIENNKTNHNKEINTLYAEMEAQINEEKKKIHIEEMEKEKRLRKTLEFELQERERRLEELVTQQKEMEVKLKKMQSNTTDVRERNSLLIEEKKLIEKEFNDSVQNLEETQAKISKLEKKKMNDKCYQRQISREISEWIELEKKNLLKQIQQLEDKNKLLTDNCDEYLEKLTSLAKPDNNHNHRKRELSLQALRNFSVDDDMIPKDIEIISSSSEDEDVKPDDIIAMNGRVYKVVFIGDSNVGKSTFIHRVCSKSFNPSLSSTIGIDFQLCNVRVDNQIIVLQLWDTAGQERYRSFSKQYFRKADGVIAMYDINNIDSFLHIRQWMEDIRDSVEQNTVLMLFGTKSDLVNRDNVTSFIYPGEARKLAYEYGASFFETSAKTGQNIETSLLYLSRVLRDKEDEDIHKSLMVLTDQTPAKKSCCKFN